LIVPQLSDDECFVQVTFHLIVTQVTSIARSRKEVSLGDFIYTISGDIIMDIQRKNALN